MPVDIESIQIFRMRGIKVAPRARAAPVSASARQAAPAGRVQPQQAKGKNKTVRVPPAQLFTSEEEAWAINASKKVKEEEQAEAAEAVNAALGKYFSETQDVEAQLIARPKAKVAVNNTLSRVAGTIMLVNAVMFAYFIYPQALFIIHDISQIGIVSFLNSINYAYGTGFADIILIAATFLAGITLTFGIGRSNALAGFVSAAMLFTSSYEYLNSNAGYLLAVSMLTFVSIGALAYSRMSAASAEEELTVQQEINWPRIETF